MQNAERRPPPSPIRPLGRPPAAPPTAHPSAPPRTSPHPSSSGATHKPSQSLQAKTRPSPPDHSAIRPRQSPSPRAGQPHPCPRANRSPKPGRQPPGRQRQQRRDQWAHRPRPETRPPLPPALRILRCDRRSASARQARIQAKREPGWSWFHQYRRQAGSRFSPSDDQGGRGGFPHSHDNYGPYRVRGPASFDKGRP
jgi:hypothetical protein